MQINGMVQGNVFQMGASVGVVLEMSTVDVETAQALADVLRMKLDILIKASGGLPIWDSPPVDFEGEFYEEVIKEIARAFLRSE